MYLLGDLSFFKIHVNHFMAGVDSPCQCYLKMHVVGEGPGATLSVLRHFLSLTSSLLKCSSILGILQARVMEWVAIAFSKKVYNSLLKTSKGALFLFPSYVYVRSFLCLFNTLIKLYYTKSCEQSSLVTGPGLNSSPPKAKNPSIVLVAATFHLGGSSRILQDKV